MSLLLMLVILGVVFIQSSEALRCYVCAHCDEPRGEKDCGTLADICVKISNSAGIRLLFCLHCAIKLS